MRVLLAASALIAATTASAVPESRPQVFLQATFAAPDGRGPAGCRGAESPRSTYGLLAPLGEPTEVRIGDLDIEHVLKVVVSAVDRSTVKLHLDQNLMRFGCGKAQPCTSSVELTLSDAEPKAVDGFAEASGTKQPQTMTVTPHIIRSAADWARVQEAMARPPCAARRRRTQ
jgi:hypothetical protein